ncbi:MAG: Magnesium and cobalt efflux protein CorC [Syntrophorhabdus sp. PtaU1.Bin058]|nr:MAG: Magnesium and cobalt efflux protein CorC [Syntrophorhabdus sp. PtaU1.Bin058]
MDVPVLVILFVVALIVLNGLFSAGEFAIVSSRKSKIREIAKKDKEHKAEKLLEMKENPERFLSAVQIGITLCGTLASAIGGIVAVQYIKPVLRQIPYLRIFDDTLSLVLVVAVLTYLFLVVGELVPKYIGMNYKEKVAIWITPFFDFITKLFFFFVNFLSFSTMFVVKGLNLKKSEDQIGAGEIKMLLEEGRRKGIFDETEEELIHGVFEFADRSVKEIMVPRPNVYSINVEDNREAIIQYIVESEFSRYPVYRDNLDNVVGVVYHKDITRQIWLKAPFNLNELLKKPYFVPDTMEISILLKEMQKRRQHLAIVIDEYGTTVGIVTLEDIMEEIFGEILDETDVDDMIERLKDGSVIINGSYSLRDLNNRFDLNLAESPDYETLGGFILNQLQEIPKGGEIIQYGGYNFTVVGMKGRRIVKVKMAKDHKARQ